MRQLRLLAYLLVGLLLGANSVLSFAETKPATSAYVYTKMQFALSGAVTTPDAYALYRCKAVYNDSNVVQTINVTVGNPDSLSFTCRNTISGAINGPLSQLANYCPPTLDAFSGQCRSKTPVLSCDDSTWTLSGSNCTRPDCRADQVRDATTGACVCGPNKFEQNGVCTSCPAAGNNAMVGGAMAWGINGLSSACSAGFAFGGCRIACTSGVSAGGKAACTGCTFTGSPANQGEQNGSPTPAPVKDAPVKPEDCLASGQGYVTGSTGLTTCVNGKDSPNPVEKTGTEKVTKDGQTTEKKTTETCDGASCTKTEETQNPDGSKTKTESQENPEDYCAKNPDSKMCGDKKTECEEHPERISCMEAGEATSSDDLEKKAIGTNSINVIGLSSNASCPADIPLPMGMSFSFEPFCQYASALRPIIIALAWLSSAFLLFGMS